MKNLLTIYYLRIVKDSHRNEGKSYPYVEGTIEGIKTNILIDTGRCITVMSDIFFDKIKISNTRFTGY